jgi:hypothetical protein
MSDSALLPTFVTDSRLFFSASPPSSDRPEAGWILVASALLIKIKSFKK